METYAKNFVLHKRKHLTFHIGNDRVWLSQDLNPYYRFNVVEMNKSIDILYERNPQLKNNQELNEFRRTMKQVRKNMDSKLYQSLKKVKYSIKPLKNIK